MCWVRCNIQPRSQLCPCYVPWKLKMPWGPQATVSHGQWLAVLCLTWNLLFTTLLNWGQFRCLLLPSVPSQAIMCTSPLPGLSQFKMCTWSSGPGTADMLGFPLVPYTGDWIDLEGNHTPTGSRIWVLLVQTSKVLSGWISRQLHGPN